MIAFYAMGGGLGHLSRARRVVEALRCPPSEVQIFTASKLAPSSDPCIVRVPRGLADSPGSFGAWLKYVLHELAPSVVIVDTFPLGILGELADHSVLPDVPVYHVARLLKWDAYRNAFAGTPRRYEASLVVEPLTPEHEALLAAHSRIVMPLELNAENRQGEENPFQSRPVWFIVHSGPAAEVRALLAFATERANREKAAPQFVVVTPRALQLPPGVGRIAHSRPWELYPHAARIVTACGFNSMLEAAPWRDKHLFLPLERRFDDQFLRATRALREVRGVCGA